MYQPLADALRPQELSDVCGQQHILGENGLLRRIIESGSVPNMIFYGPSGTGKTTVANLIAKKTQRKLCKLNATTASSADIKEIYAQLDTFLAPNGVLLYLDEIQYFNKKQQQTLLEYIENGKITLIASTTENPYFYVYNAILSRSTVFEFKPVEKDEAQRAVSRALNYLEARDSVTILPEPGVKEHIAQSCGGDIRKALNAVEFLYTATRPENGVVRLTMADAKQVSQRSAMRYDKSGDDHYDDLSALMKSIRGSNPDAAVHYLARFLEAGDLPSACRRILCSVAEDIGLAYPQAIPIVKACVDSALQLGLPEARLPLADGPEVQFRLHGHRCGHRRCEGRQNRPRPARAAKCPRRRHGLRARPGLSLPAQFPESLGPAAVSPRRDQRPRLLHLRRQQNRTGRQALLGRDQEVTHRSRLSWRRSRLRGCGKKPNN